MNKGVQVIYNIWLLISSSTILIALSHWNILFFMSLNAMDWVMDRQPPRTLSQGGIFSIGSQLLLQGLKA